MRRHWHRHTHECPTIIAYFVFAMSHTGPHDANKYTTKLTNKSEQQLFCSHLNDSKQRKKVAKNRRNDMIISAMLPFIISFHSISFEFTRFYIFTARTERFVNVIFGHEIPVWLRISVHMYSKMYVFRWWRLAANLIGFDLFGLCFFSVSFFLVHSDWSFNRLCMIYSHAQVHPYILLFW